MGYAIAFSACIGCRRTFGYNPLRVPSLMWQGSREPICRACVDRVNPSRIANGLEPIVPAPDAYEPVNESEMP